MRIHATGVKRLHHPVVGDLDLPFESLPLAVGSSWSLVAYTPDPGSATQDAIALLASWEASQPVPSAVAAIRSTSGRTSPGPADLPDQ